MTGKERHNMRSKELDEQHLRKIQELSLFTGVSYNDFGSLVGAMKYFKLKKGELVFQSGDSADLFYIVLSGRIKIYKGTPKDQAQILYIYSAGDFVGGLNLLKDDNYLYTGQALEDCTIVTLSKAGFENHMLTNPLLLKQIIVKCYDRIRWAEDLIDRLSSSNALIKSANLLLHLIDNFGQEQEDGSYRLDLTINREEMGSYAGLTRETITRKLCEFRDAGILQFIGNKTIIINDLEELKRRAVSV